MVAGLFGSAKVAVPGPLTSDQVVAVAPEALPERAAGCPVPVAGAGPVAISGAGLAEKPRRRAGRRVMSVLSSEWIRVMTVEVPFSWASEARRTKWTEPCVMPALTTAVSAAVLGKERGALRSPAGQELNEASRSVPDVPPMLSHGRLAAESERRVQFAPLVVSALVPEVLIPEPSVNGEASPRSSIAGIVAFAVPTSSAVQRSRAALRITAPAGMPDRSKDSNARKIAVLESLPTRSWFLAPEFQVVLSPRTNVAAC